MIIASESVVAHDMVLLAWLLENCRTTPEDRRDGVIDDTSQSAFVVSIANCVVNGLLGG